jgi:hypothetical protein
MSANAKFEIDASTARIVLENLELEIKGKRLAYDGLANEIERLETAHKSLREQFNRGREDSGRAEQGNNHSRIKEYLSKIAGNKGVKASQIAKDTGIGNSSIAYTLSKHENDFEQDEDTKRWKLKPQQASLV